MSGSYRLLRTFQVDGIGTVEFLERIAGYDSYHIRLRGDSTTHPTKIPKRDARALLNGVSPQSVLGRYAKALR